MCAVSHQLGGLAEVGVAPGGVDQGVDLALPDDGAGDRPPRRLRGRPAATRRSGPTGRPRPGRRPAAGRRPARCRRGAGGSGRPGTSSRAGAVAQAPSRFTRALSASLALSAAMALPAWYSSQKPTTALTTSRTRMMPKSGPVPHARPRGSPRPRSSTGSGPRSRRGTSGADWAFLLELVGSVLDESLLGDGLGETIRRRPESVQQVVERELRELTLATGSLREPGRWDGRARAPRRRQAEGPSCGPPRGRVFPIDNRLGRVHAAVGTPYHRDPLRALQMTSAGGASNRSMEGAAPVTSSTLDKEAAALQGSNVPISVPPAPGPTRRGCTECVAATGPFRVELLDRSAVRARRVPLRSVRCRVAKGSSERERRRRVGGRGVRDRGRCLR